MDEMTMLDQTPEELLLETSQARGLAVRVHRLSWFSIEVVTVIERDESVTVVRRELDVGARGVVTSKAEERFVCRPHFLAKLDRQLARLGVAEGKSFAAEGGLDGVSISCRYRAPAGGLHHVHLFCWDDSPDRKVRRLGDFLQQLARSSGRALRRRAWFSRFW